MEKELNKLYREIAKTVNEMIPEEWEKFYFYAQVSETGGGTYFFYNATGTERLYKYSLEIPFKYEIDEEEFEKREDLLYKLSMELRSVFKDNKQELWYSFTLALDSKGSLKVHFDYTNWFNTNYSFDDQLIIWEYKYLEEELDGNENKDLINRYLDEYPNNPI